MRLTPTCPVAAVPDSLSRLAAGKPGLNASLVSTPSAASKMTKANIRFIEWGVLGSGLSVEQVNEQETSMM